MIEVNVEEIVEEKKPDTIEKLAKEHGWNPEGEKSADEYIEFALQNLPERGKQLKRMQKTMDALIDHNRKQEQIAYDKALKDLALQKHEAISRGDSASVQAIEQQAEQLKPVPVSSPAIIDFQERNADWLQSNSAEHKKMQAYTFGMDSILMAEKLSPEEHMEKLEEAVKEQFPDHFGIKHAVRSPVEGGTGSNLATRNSKKTFSFSDLNEQQRKIAEEFEFYKIMTKEQYVKDLVKSGDLK